MAWTTKNIKSCVRYWSKKLRVDHWDIEVSTPGTEEARKRSGHDFDVDGSTKWDICSHTAMIDIVPDAIGIPHTIIHELLHLRNESHKATSQDDSDEHYEYAINVIAGVLLEQDMKLNPRLYRNWEGDSL